MSAAFAMPPGLTLRQQTEWELDADPAAAGLEPVVVVIAGARRDHQLEAWFDPEEDFAIIRVFLIKGDRQREVRDILDEETIQELECSAQQAHGRH